MHKLAQFILDCSQAVRHQTLTLACASSNLASPASIIKAFRDLKVLFFISKLVYLSKVQVSLINTDEKGIEFKVTGNNKFSIFDIGKSLKEIYAIDSKFCPITAFRVNIINSKLTAISSSTLKSDLYFYKQGFQEENRKIKHFTSQTKIYKIEYYNDSISRVFGNSSFDIDLKRVQKK